MNIKYTIEIRAPAKKLFELTQDYSKRTLWDPLTKQAFLVNAQTTAAGEHVRCIAKNGMSMDTIYVSYKPYKVAAVKLIKGPSIFDTFAGGWQFDELEPGRTRVKFSYAITTKPRWLSWLLTPIVVAGFKFETRRRIRALKCYAESRSSSLMLSRQASAPNRHVLHEPKGSHAPS